MHTQLIPATRTPILRCAAPITRIDDALDIMSAAYEHGASKLLLREADLPAAFFDLSTKFAGEFVQKFMNYSLVVALVVVDENAYSNLFRQFVLEARTGRQFRTFADEADALAWLDGVG